MSHGITATDSMFSVSSRRQPPWHGLGVVLDEYPRSSDEALAKSGLGWEVRHGDVLVVNKPEWTDDFGVKHPPDLIPVKGFKALSGRTRAMCLGSSRTSTKSWITRLPSPSWTH
ncbi:MAG: hypothetical protein JO168_10900 [Solirubrobacterales bacterium]|nr:hypothetical protein [Solirubrobacterales bacterium]